MTDDASEPITLTVEIDPARFDEPHQLIYERLVQEFGRDIVVDLVAANLSQELTARQMNLIDPLGNPDQIQVEPAGVETPEAPDLQGVADD